MSSPDTRAVFVAAPFTRVFPSKGGPLAVRIRRAVEVVIRVCQRQGRQVFSAQVHEDWGRVVERPEALATRDLSEMRAADEVIALLFAEAVSVGVLVELGIAVSLGRRILVVDEGGWHVGASDFLRGIRDAGIVEYASDGDLEERVRKFLAPAPR